MDRGYEEGFDKRRMALVIAGLATAGVGLWMLAVALLPGSGAGSQRIDLFFAVGVSALIAGTQIAAQYAMPLVSQRRTVLFHGDPGTRREFALQSTVPYFKRASCTSVAIAVASIATVRWVELRFGCPQSLYWVAAVPVIAALVASLLEVHKKARSF